MNLLAPTKPVEEPALSQAPDLVVNSTALWENHTQGPRVLLEAAALASELQRQQHQQHQLLLQKNQAAPVQELGLSVAPIEWTCLTSSSSKPTYSSSLSMLPYCYQPQEHYPQPIMEELVLAELVPSSLCPTTVRKSASSGTTLHMS